MRRIMRILGIIITMMICRDLLSSGLFLLWLLMTGVVDWMGCFAKLIHLHRNLPSICISNRYYLGLLVYVDL